MNIIKKITVWIKYNKFAFIMISRMVSYSVFRKYTYVFFFYYNNNCVYVRCICLTQINAMMHIKHHHFRFLKINLIQLIKCIHVHVLAFKFNNGVCVSLCCTNSSSLCVKIVWYSICCTIRIRGVMTKIKLF